MRTLILTIFITLLISCDGEDIGKSTRIRIIKNLSNHEVDLVIKSKDSIFYHLSIGDSIVFNGYCETGAGDLCFVGWDELYFISGKIIFDKEKEILYPNSSCNEQNNPFGGIREFDLCGYSEKTIEGIKQYLYVIDDSNYEIAVRIED